MVTNMKKSPGHDRVQLLRDIIAFQVKLIADGIRDLLLAPASLIAGIISLVRPRRATAFYDVLELGKKSEDWINLFGAVDRDEAREAGQPGAKPADIDELVSRVEAYVVDEYRSGQITGQARKRLDRALEALRGKPSARE